MEKVTLYVGLNDKDTHTQKIDTLEAVKVITNIITEKCGGGTIYNAVGVYTHTDGTIITENTLKIELFDCNDEAIDTTIKALKTVLNQESIIKQTELINSVFC